MDADLYSPVLALFDVDDHTATSFDAGGDWSLRLRHSNGGINVTAVRTGSCWIQLPEYESPIEVHAGDVAIVNNHTWHTLSSDPTLMPHEATAMLTEVPPRSRAFGTAPQTAVFAAHISLAEPGRTLFRDISEPFTMVEASTAEAQTVSWLLQKIWGETTEQLPGADVLARHYVTTMFAEVLRHHFRRHDPASPSLLRLWANAEFAPAVGLMNNDPAHPWRLSELAQATNMSRTSFAERFREIAGMTALEYLRRWRIMIAMRALKQEDVSISQIASSVGFSSASAFSNAFKQSVGVSPREFHRNAQQSALE